MPLSSAEVISHGTTQRSIDAKRYLELRYALIFRLIDPNYAHIYVDRRAIYNPLLALRIRSDKLSKQNIHSLDNPEILSMPLNYLISPITQISSLPDEIVTFFPFNRSKRLSKWEIDNSELAEIYKSRLNSQPSLSSNHQSNTIINLADIHPSTSIQLANDQPPINHSFSSSDRHNSLLKSIFKRQKQKPNLSRLNLQVIEKLNEPVTLHNNNSHHDNILNNDNTQSNITSSSSSSSTHKVLQNDTVISRSSSHASSIANMSDHSSIVIFVQDESAPSLPLSINDPISTTVTITPAPTTTINTTAISPLTNNDPTLLDLDSTTQLSLKQQLLSPESSTIHLHHLKSQRRSSLTSLNNITKNLLSDNNAIASASFTALVQLLTPTKNKDDDSEYESESFALNKKENNNSHRKSRSRHPTTSKPSTPISGSPERTNNNSGGRTPSPISQKPHQSIINHHTNPLSLEQYIFGESYKLPTTIAHTIKQTIAISMILGHPPNLIPPTIISTMNQLTERTHALVDEVVAFCQLAETSIPSQLGQFAHLLSSSESLSPSSLFTEEERAQSKAVESAITGWSQRLEELDDAVRVRVVRNTEQQKVLLAVQGNVDSLQYKVEEGLRPLVTRIEKTLKGQSENKLNENELLYKFLSLFLRGFFFVLGILLFIIRLAKRVVGLCSSRDRHKRDALYEIPLDYDTLDMLSNEFYKNVADRLSITGHHEKSPLLSPATTAFTSTPLSKEQVISESKQTISLDKE